MDKKTFFFEVTKGCEKKLIFLYIQNVARKEICESPEISALTQMYFVFK